MEIKTIVVLFRFLVEAVARLHDDYSVCHRDLKPDNVIVSDCLTSLKLIDFNVAVCYKETGGNIQGGTGYKHWSAPETRKDLNYNEKCDVWSLGLILVFMLTNGGMPKEELSFEENKAQALLCSPAPTKGLIEQMLALKALN